MASTELENKLVRALEERAPEHGIDIVDVEVVGASKAPTVRVRIDNADEESHTITLDEVAAQSGWINEVIDQADPIGGSFMLEVSSPGLSRPLRKERDFVRFAGEDVSLSTNGFEGRRRFTGRLAGMADGKVRIECEDGTFDFDLSQIKSCKIKPKFD